MKGVVATAEQDEHMFLLWPVHARSTNVVSSFIYNIVGSEQITYEGERNWEGEEGYMSLNKSAFRDPIKLWRIHRNP